MRSTILFAMLLILSSSAAAHGGGVDSEGCHKSGRKGYHCHPDRMGNKESAGSAESAKARDRRLKRECKGAVNAGLCQGYTR